jgi:hypothetical protein
VVERYITRWDDQVGYLVVVTNFCYIISLDTPYGSRMPTSVPLLEILVDTGDVSGCELGVTITRLFLGFMAVPTLVAMIHI